MDLQPLTMHSDTRGTLVEAFKLPNDGQVFYVNSAPGQTRGNHYHMRKTENFLTIFGSTKMQIKDRDTDNLMEVTTSGGRPMLVSVLANHTHSITALEDGAIFLVWTDEQFNPDDADTYPEEIWIPIR